MIVAFTKICLGALKVHRKRKVCFEFLVFFLAITTFMLYFVPHLQGSNSHTSCPLYIAVKKVTAMIGVISSRVTNLILSLILIR